MSNGTNQPRKTPKNLKQQIKPVNELEDNYGDFILGFKVIQEDERNSKSFRIERDRNREVEINEEINIIKDDFSDQSWEDASEIKNPNKKKSKKKGGCCGLMRRSEEDDFNFY